MAANSLFSHISMHAQAVVIIIGAIYAVYEYWRIRKFRPRIEFDVDFTVSQLETKGRFLIVIVLTLYNKGSVRKKLPEIDVEVKTLADGDIEHSVQSGRQLRFTRQLVESHNVVKIPEDPWWIDPGVTQRIRYPVVIDNPAAFVQVNSRFFYYRPQWRVVGLYKKGQALKSEKKHLIDTNRFDVNDPERIFFEKKMAKFNKRSVDYHQATRVKSVLRGNELMN